MKQTFAMIAALLAAGSVHAATLYVWTNSPANGPGTAWTNAWWDIQSAVDVATTNDLVLVTNGVYATGGRKTPGGSLTNRIVVTNALTVRSVNGPADTIIVGKGPWGFDAVRCAYLANGAVLSGFTLTNGYTAEFWGVFLDQSGGGALAAGAVITNCTIAGNSSSWNAYGGGVCYGTVVDCTISGNGGDWESAKGTMEGGGAAFCTLVNCTISNNVALDQGGGVYSGTVDRCTIVTNVAGSYGGGTCRGTVRNSTISGNIAYLAGGGACLCTLSNCTISANWTGDDYGGGGTEESTVFNSTITGNRSDAEGGGARLSTLYNCLVTGNSASNGGGTASGTARGCAIMGNSAGRGGGSYAGTLINCTVSDNSALQEGGGTMSAKVTNSIVYYNSAPSGSNHSSSTFGFSCTTPDPGGTSNITVEPLLANTTHLATNSPCIGVGNFAACSGMDIDGETWLNPPSMGCDEVVPGALTGGLAVAIWEREQAWRGTWVVNVPKDLLADITGRVAGSTWDFGDGGTATNNPYQSYTWSVTGDYPVTLTAWNDTYPAGVAVTAMVHVMEQSIHCVSVDSTNPVTPYVWWHTAASNIQDAIDVCMDGGIVQVSNGVYATGRTNVPGDVLKNRIVVTNPITVRSMNGPSNTLISGQGPLGTTAVRCAYLANGAVLAGFTLTNGFTRTSGDVWRDQSGGGAYASGAVVTNCTITGNEANQCGGGMAKGTAYNCTITGNTASNGGGVARLAAHDCMIAGNTAYSGGGGAWSGLLSRCTISGNYAANGGGVSGIVVSNSTITGNRAEYSGGGSSQAELFNCVISGNSAPGGGGGTSQGLTYNSTITGNSAVTNGGGARAGELFNSIVYYNTASNGEQNIQGALCYYCCVEGGGGPGSISNTPLFKNRAAGDFHLLYGSPCIDRGTNLAGLVDDDFDGNSRPLDGNWDGTNSYDIGAYEYNPSTADSDDDGLTDSNEVCVVGTSPTNTDTDGDWMGDGDEVFADTVATDSNSYFHLTAVGHTNSFSVWFVCTNSRAYSLQFASNLVTGPWPGVAGQTNVTGEADGEMSLTDPADATQRSYRVRVSMP
ncbi:MAG: choice-of-anchor Q domain-containing protein [Verrucomicrobiota bacterium]